MALPADLENSYELYTRASKVALTPSVWRTGNDYPAELGAACYQADEAIKNAHDKANKYCSAHPSGPKCNAAKKTLAEMIKKAEATIPILNRLDSLFECEWENTEEMDPKIRDKITSLLVELQKIYFSIDKEAADTLDDLIKRMRKV